MFLDGLLARIWKVEQLTSGVRGSACGAAGLLEMESRFCINIAEQSAHIRDAAFSPDGTALAIATADGYVMFFQVTITHRPPTLLAFGSHLIFILSVS